MITLDTSVVVASFGAWHEHHRIALAARAAGAELLTLDRRALTTYRRCGADVRLLA